MSYLVWDAAASPLSEMYSRVPGGLGTNPTPAPQQLRDCGPAQASVSLSACGGKNRALTPWEAPRAAPAQRSVNGARLHPQGWTFSLRAVRTSDSVGATLSFVIFLPEISELFSSLCSSLCCPEP